LWTAVNHFQVGILGWVLGDPSAQTFKPLWDEVVSKWKCYFYVTDGWKVYPMFIPDGDHIVSKTYMTRVEGENTRLRHPASSLKKKNSLLFSIRQQVAQTFNSITHSLS
jgi:insertion element IS1 protein InsB